VTVSSGVFDTESAFSKFGNTTSKSLITDSLTSKSGVVDELRSRDADIDTLQVEDLTISEKLNIGGETTFTGNVTVDRMNTQESHITHLDVSYDTVLSGTVDFNMRDLTLPANIYCKDELKVQSEVATSRLSGNTLTVSRIVIGPAGMTFV
jgi:hypothetical protein